MTIQTMIKSATNDVLALSHEDPVMDSKNRHT